MTENDEKKQKETKMDFNELISKFQPKPQKAENSKNQTITQNKNINNNSATNILKNKENLKPKKSNSILDMINKFNKKEENNTINLNNNKKPQNNPSQINETTKEKTNDEIKTIFIRSESNTQKQNNENNENNKIKLSKKIIEKLDELKNNSNKIINNFGFSNNCPKKLNLDAIFKNIKINEILSSLNKKKQEEIIKSAETRKNKEDEEQRETQKEECENEDLDNNSKIKPVEEFNLYQDQDTLYDQCEENENDLDKSNEKDYLTYNNEMERVDMDDFKKNLNLLFEKRMSISQTSISQMIISKDKNNIAPIGEKKKNENIIGEQEKKDYPEAPLSERKKDLKTENDIVDEEDYLAKFKTMNPDKNEKHTKNKINIRGTLQNISRKISLIEKKINKIEEIFLESRELSENENIENTFCESFILVSFSEKNGKIVENSEKICADCNHEICSILPAMQPEIIYKYPQKNIHGLELSNLAASICFPNGIKTCYEDNKEKIEAMKSYKTTLTNQKGDIYFVMTFHFLYKMLNDEFCSKYTINPLNYTLSTYTENINNTFNEESININQIEEKIQTDIKKFSEIRFKENVYIPFCLCLISKYPFYEEMEKCLGSIFITLNNEDFTISQINEYITYLVKSIPGPIQNKKLNIPLLNCNHLLEITYPFFEDMCLFGVNPVVLIKYLHIEHIILLFRLLLFEQKILIVGENYDIVSQIILASISLLYPFQWIHTSIPIMSEKMIKYLQAFLPFFNGMNTSLYKRSKKVLMTADEGVFIFDLDNHTVYVNTYLRKKSPFWTTIVYINENLPNFPKNIENILSKGLKFIKSYFNGEKNHNNNYKVLLETNFFIRNLFLHVFVELFYDYDKYLNYIDDFPVFNTFMLLNQKPKNDSFFYKEITSTQLFQMFIQKCLGSKEGSSKKFYFNERIKDYLDLKKEINICNNTTEIISCSLNKFKTKFMKNLEIEKNYIIKPNYMKNFENFESKFTKKKLKLKDVNDFLSKQFDKIYTYYYLNTNGTIKRNKRILNKKFNLSHENDPEKLKIYIYPEENIDYKKSNSDGSNNINLLEKKRRSSKVRILGDDGRTNSERCLSFVTNKECDLTEDEIIEIKENIRETMTRVFKSEITNIEDDKKLIMSSVEKSFGRDYFINVIFPSTKIDKNVQLFNETSYNLLSLIIKNSLLNILKLEENKENIMCAVKLFKACLYIKTIEKGKELLLSDDLFFKMDDYPLIQKEIFWEYWVDSELSEENIELLKLIKEKIMNKQLYEFPENDTNYENYENQFYEVLDGLVGIMIKFKLKSDNIFSLITDLSQDYIKEERRGKLIESLIDQLYFYKLHYENLRNKNKDLVKNET